jgi:hypothetical protein
MTWCKACAYTMLQSGGVSERSSRFFRFIHCVHQHLWWHSEQVGIFCSLSIPMSTIFWIHCSHCYSRLRFCISWLLLTSRRVSFTLFCNLSQGNWWSGGWGRRWIFSWSRSRFYAFVGGDSILQNPFSSPGFETVHMYRGDFPDLSTENNSLHMIHNLGPAAAPKFSQLISTRKSPADFRPHN